MSDIILSKENFEEEVLKSEKPVLVDFFATWCGPCKMMAPVVEEIANEKKDSLKVCKVDIDEEPELADKYQIDLIPTLILFKSGKEVKNIIGLHSKSEIKEFVEGV